MTTLNIQPPDKLMVYAASWSLINS